MKAMQNLVKVPEIQATMRELSKEMMKVWTAARNIERCYYPLSTMICSKQKLIFQAGIIEEMLEDTFESMEDGEEMEEAAEEEVDKILFDITAGNAF